MKQSQTRQRIRCLCAALFSLFIVLSFESSSSAQNTAPAADSPNKILEEINSKYPGLLADLGHLLVRLQNEIRYPAPRSESRLLPLLPESTVLYAAIPNYGDAAHQAAEILQAEVKQRAALHTWIEKNEEWKKLEPKIEDSLEKFSQAQAYLGDEVAFAGGMKSHAPEFLAVAEVRKPGLREFLEKTIQELGKSKAGLRILGPQQLSETVGEQRKDQLLVLVRPDFVVAASEMATLRGFNERLEQRSARNAAPPSAFQERIRKEYAVGTSTLAAADLHKLLNQLPPIAQREMGPLERNGLGNLQYLVWNRKSAEHETIGDAELSFSSPRKAAAAWLGNSRRLTTLDFVSPKATIAITLVMRDPAQIFEEIRAMSGPNQNAFASLSQFEEMLKVSLKDDVLANLNGEVTIELDGLDNPMPGWRVIFGTKDGEHLKQTFNALLGASPFVPQRFEQGGISYTSIEIPRGTAGASGKDALPPMKIGYAFCDGHLIFGSGSDSVAEAVRFHRTGETLEKSQTLLTRLPAGHSLEASALFFQDPAAMWSLQLRMFSPELAKAASQLLGKSSPSLTVFYADDTSIRAASRSSGTDVTTTLVVAAIAIPNLLRSRLAANETSAVGSVRTINTAEVTYEVMYPKLGYASSLGKLGPDHPEVAKPTPEHADLISESLASENCSADGWCINSGYRFNLKGVCRGTSCTEYVVTAVPVSNNTGNRGFCSTSDGIIRFRLAGEAQLQPLTVAECRKWEPIR